MSTSHWLLALLMVSTILPSGMAMEPVDSSTCSTTQETRPPTWSWSVWTRVALISETSVVSPVRSSASRASESAASGAVSPSPAARSSV